MSASDNRRFRIVSLWCLLITLIVLAIPSQQLGRLAAADWFQFLGPERNGVSPEVRLADLLACCWPQACLASCRWWWDVGDGDF